MTSFYDISFVSNTNHTDLASSSSGPSHVRSLSHYLSPATQASMATNYSTATQRLIPGDHTFVPTLEFRVPLLPQGMHFAPDFQAGAPAIRHSIPSWCKILHDEPAVGGSNGEGSRSQTSASATISVPVSVPVALPLAPPVAVPFSCDIRPPTAPTESGPSNESSATSSLEEILAKRESPALLLQDICHVGSSSVENLADPPPIIACNSPDLLAAARFPKVTNKTGHSSSLASAWSSPVSVPSLSYSSFSGSENNSLILTKEASFNDVLRLSLTPPLLPKANGDTSSPLPFLGIFADVNMRGLASDTQHPLLYVNPADVMAATYSLSSLSSDDATSPNGELGARSTTPVAAQSRIFATLAKYLESPSARQLSPAPDYTVDFPDDALIDQDFPVEAISAIVSVLQSSTASVESPPSPRAPLCTAETALPPQAFMKACELVAPQPVYAQHRQVYLGSGSDLGMLHPSLASSTGAAAVPGPSTFPNSRVPLADARIPQLQYTAPPYAPYPPANLTQTPAYVFPHHQTTQQAHIQAQAVPDSPHPVLNAHVGIPLDELRRRATDYRQRHEGAELDKTFLQNFAGRLSERGELLDDYRCYVVGCGQRNKRRDHILVHVGSHVEHRPWACQHCGMKFLRKNECKRHESSHEGRKPYSCQICAPFQDRSFVRQDLLKRHLRVSHGVHDTNTRKKAQSRKGDADYWP